MSGEARVEDVSSVRGARFKYVNDLAAGDEIMGLDENKEETTCSVVAVGRFGKGPVFGNYTKDHFNLDGAGELVAAHGRSGDEGTSDLYAVLTSCPVGLDEAGVGFSPVSSLLLGDEPLAWSDYVAVHGALLGIVREVGAFVLDPSTYTSIDEVGRYTNKFYKTLLGCARDPAECHAFENAAEELVENSVTDEAKAKVRSKFGNLGKSYREGSISASATRGRSVRL